MAEHDHEIDPDAKKLVLARLAVLPTNIGVAVGSGGSYSKRELLKHIEAEDEVGKKFINLELEFLRMLKAGALFEE